MVALKTLIFTIFVPGTVAIWVPSILLSSPGARGSMNLAGFRYVGLVAIVIGASIYLWCAWDFTFAGKGTPAPIDPPTSLVVRGLYKYVRNPMYVGVLTLILGQAIWFASVRMLEYAALAFVLMHAFVLLYEEPALRRKFGDSYEQYRESIPRWIPGPRASNQTKGGV